MMGLFGTYASVYTDIGITFVILSAILAWSARYYINKKRPFIHMILNVTAVVFLYIFLSFYLLNYITGGVYSYGGTGLSVIFYYLFLIIHIIGAASLGILCTYLVVRSLLRFDNSQETEWKKFPFEKEYRPLHKKIGRINDWLWLFTAFSGVAVYLMLYVLAKPVRITGAF